MMMLAGSVITWRGRRRESFYVAGARFFPPNHRLVAGDAVALVPAIVCGKRALRVEDMHGVQIGYVPRALVARVHAAGMRRAALVEVRLQGVPWRWYRLAFDLGESALRHSQAEIGSG